MARGSANLLVLITGKNLASTAFSQARSDMQKLGKEGQATQQKVGLASSALKGAALGAGAAIGYMGLRWAKEGIQGAIEEESAIARLSQALANVGQATRLTGVEDFISQTSRASAVADDELRPALVQLVTATRDVDKAQRLLSVALDISRAKNKSLESVTTALSRASMGNFTSLTRLGVPLSENTKKTKDFEAAIGELNNSFGGNAAAFAATTAGKFEQLANAATEAKESFGRGFLQSTAQADGQLKNITDQLYDMQPAFEQLGKNVGSAAMALGQLADIINKLHVIDAMTWSTDMMGKVFARLGQEVTWVTDRFKTGADAFQQASGDFKAGGGDFDSAASSIRGATDASQENRRHIIEQGIAMQGAADKAKMLAAAVNRMRDQFAAASGKFRSAVQTQSDLIAAIQSMRSEVDGLTPALSRNRRAFNLTTEGGRRAAEALSNVADNAEQAALAAADAGKWNRAARLLGMAREAIAQQAMQWGMSEAAARSYANTLLAIPSEIQTVIRTIYVQQQGLGSADANETWGQNMPRDYNPYRIGRLPTGTTRSMGGSGSTGGLGGKDAAAQRREQRRKIRGAMMQAAQDVAQARLDLATGIASSAFGFGSVLGFDTGSGSSARSTLSTAVGDVKTYAAAIRGAKRDILSIGPGSDPETLRRRAEARKALAEAERDHAAAIARRDRAQAAVDRTALTGKNVLASMRQRVARVKQFGGLLRRLGRAGLNPTTLAEIAQSGPDEGFAIAKAMADSPDLMGAFNRAQRNLAKYSAKAGKYVATQSYMWDVAAANARSMAKAGANDMQPIVVELKLDTATVVRQIVGYKRRTGNRELGIS